MSHKMGRTNSFGAPIRLHDLEQQRDDAIRRCILLPLLAEPAEVEHGVEYLVRDLAEMLLPFPHGLAQNIDQEVDGICRVQRFDGSGEHR